LVKKKVVDRIRPIQGITLLVSFILGFLYINNPVPGIKEAATMGHFFVTSMIAFLVITISTPALKSLTVPSSREFFAESAVGMVFGLISASFISLFMALVGSLTGVGLDVTGIRNLMGSIPALTVQRMGTTSLLIVSELQPFVETALLVGGTVVIADMLKPYLSGFKLHKIMGGLITAAFFGTFHFQSIAISGISTWEYSIPGFISFLTSVNGALPHFVMGIFWVLIFIIFDSFILIYQAHRVVNLISLGQILGFNNDVVQMTILLDVGIFLLVYFLIPKLFWQKFNDYDLRRLYS